VLAAEQSEGGGEWVPRSPMKLIYGKAILLPEFCVFLVAP
jgi:hypothetical protein